MADDDPVNPVEAPEGPADSWESAVVSVPVNPTKSPEGPVDSWESAVVSAPVNPPKSPEGPVDSWEATKWGGPEAARGRRSDMFKGMLDAQPVASAEG